MAEKLNIFLSWSGERSRLVARALADWLPYTLQSVECWISDTDIGAGAQWSSELRAQLDSCSFGILCLTPENLTSPWLLFEAGYLAKSISGQRIVPYLHKLKPTDVTYPLAQFQSAQADLDGTIKLLATLNFASPQPMSEEKVDRLAEKWWPDLELKLSDIVESPSFSPTRPTSADRDNRALLEEVLALVRGLQAPASSPMTVPASAAYRDKVLLPTWTLRFASTSPPHETTVNIPWEFPASEASPTEPKYPPVLKAEELRSLRSDELDNYARILDIAYNMSDVMGFEEHIDRLRDKLRDERARRQRSSS